MRKFIVTITLIILVVASFTVGYYIGLENGKHNIAQEILDVMSFSICEIDMVNGRISEINDNSVILEIGLLDTRIVTVNDNTEIMKIYIDPFLLVSQNLTEMEEIDIEFGELMVGDKITVKADENIKIKKEFVASKIILIE